MNEIMEELQRMRAKLRAYFANHGVPRRSTTTSSRT